MFLDHVEQIETLSSIDLGAGAVHKPSTVISHEWQLFQVNNPTLKTSYCTPLLEGTSPTTVSRGWVYYTNLNEGHTTHEQEGTPCSDAYRLLKIFVLCVFFVH